MVMASQPSQGTHVPDYENHKVLQRNRLPARSYFLPETCVPLNGKWDFHYAPSPLHAPEPRTAPGSDNTVIESTIGTTSSDDDELSLSMLELGERSHPDWVTIDVPGHWQLQGHGHPNYTNVVYPFPVRPPHVPSENPTGTYRRTFHVPREWDSSSQLRLRFDGVDSAYHVWVNGVEVGYAQGSRNPAEFDVTHVAKRNGINELFVRVYQWSDGSYIEDQDQWWLSGIFRDVHLLAFPSSARIEDYFVKTELDSAYMDATLRVSLNLHVKSSCVVRGTLYDSLQDDNILQSKEVNVTSGEDHTEITISVSNPKKWTAETPILYKIEISLFSANDSSTALQKLTHKVGFRVVEIKRGNITVNGNPIMFRGVNRHDHHPLLGRAVPLSFIKQDLLLMKRHNINAVRCSHYPSHPQLLDICDEIGLWVIDEADLECHGFYDAVARPLNIPESMDYEERKKLVFKQAAMFTTDNPEWKDAYIDRMDQVMQRDKNHASVIIWSLGNEGFYGQNFQAMYAYAKEFDPSRPVHYEGDAKALTADMFSYMYIPLERLIEFATTEGDDFQKPIILCEYAHAMGNAPGGLEEYMEAFRQYRRLQGGFVWEWANHGLWKEPSQAGETGYYAYGGDFGDFPNDRNFVMDGLCFSDHTPTPGLVELSKVYEPLRGWVENDQIILENGYNFISLDDFLAFFRIETFTQESSKIIHSGTLHIPYVPAGKRGSIPVPSDISIPPTGETWLSVSFRSKYAYEWAESNTEVAWFQHCLRSNLSFTVLSDSKKIGLEIRTNAATQTIVGSTFSLTFSRVTGNLTNWIHNGLSLLEPDPVTKSALSVGLWRPPTDNDIPFDLIEWRRYGLDCMTYQLQSMKTARLSDGSIRIRSAAFIGTPILAWGFQANSVYTLSMDGTLNVSIHLTPEGPAPSTLPRIGLDLYLVDSLDNATWFGRGPGECYVDKKLSQKIGIYKSTTSNLYTPYEVPQENGNRLDTRWLRMGDNRGWGFKAARISSKSEGKNENSWDAIPFQWAASRYSAQTIENAKHPHDLATEKAVRLRLDIASAGVGTGACGPRTLEKYQVSCEESTVSFLLEPSFGDLSS